MSAKKTPLLLIPGLLCDDALWEHQAINLADIADVTIAQDHTRHDSMMAIAEAILARAPGQFALAGLSMGGYIALEIMRRAPGRVSRLAVLDSNARADTEEQAPRRRGLIELAEKGKFKGVTPRLLPLFLHPDRLDDDEMTHRVMAMAERVGKDAFLRQQHAILGRDDSRPFLHEIEVPTLVLCGRQDALTPLEMSEEIADLIPSARLAVIEDCGHLSTMERPDAVTAELRRWLLGD